MLLLDNPIQNYAWGSRTRLASLLGHAPSKLPEAELWIGAHPKAPSGLSDGRTLLEAIRGNPERMLGSDVAQRFGGTLPFLLKVLAVDAPLSLQAHPTREQARAGFAREEGAGIPLGAPERTYKDDNHKPELLCALTPFEALSGFRPAEEAAQLFDELGVARVDLARQLREPHPEALRRAFTRLMQLPNAEKLALTSDVLSRAARAAEAPGRFRAALTWAVRLGEQYPGDIGVVASLMLEHIELAPLEAIYLEAGRLHAYLSGMGVELMANSDNVLRGGLTPKHVDVPELLRVLVFESAPLAPVRKRTEPGGEIVYETPTPEFRLSRLEISDGHSFAAQVSGPEILLCVEGQARVELMPGGSGGEPAVQLPPRALRRGQACFLPASTGRYRLHGAGRIFRARAG